MKKMSIQCFSYFSICNETNRYSMIWSCWCDKAEGRPSFRDLISSIGSMPENDVDDDSHQYFTLESN